MKLSRWLGASVLVLAAGVAVAAANRTAIFSMIARSRLPPVAPNQPVATLLEPNELWVRVYVPETELGHVQVGQAARIRVDSFPQRDFAGRVVEIRHRAEYLPRNVQTLDQRP